MNEKDLNKSIALVGSLCIAYHLYKYLRYRYCYEHILNKAKRCCLPNCHSPLITSTILYNIYLDNKMHLFHFFIVSYKHLTYIISCYQEYRTISPPSKIEGFGTRVAIIFYQYRQFQALVSEPSRTI